MNVQVYCDCYNPAPAVMVAPHIAADARVLQKLTKNYWYIEAVAEPHIVVLPASPAADSSFAMAVTDCDDDLLGDVLAAAAAAEAEPSQAAEPDTVTVIQRPIAQRSTLNHYCLQFFFICSQTTFSTIFCLYICYITVSKHM